MHFYLFQPIFPRALHNLLEALAHLWVLVVETLDQTLPEGEPDATEQLVGQVPADKHLVEVASGLIVVNVGPLYELQAALYFVLGALTGIQEHDCVHDPLDDKDTESEDLHQLWLLKLDVDQGE